MVGSSKQVSNLGFNVDVGVGRTRNRDFGAHTSDLGLTWTLDAAAAIGRPRHFPTGAGIAIRQVCRLQFAECFPGKPTALQDPHLSAVEELGRPSEPALDDVLHMTPRRE